MLNYRTKVLVDGVGEYQIEVTNVVDKKNFEERPIVPTILNTANVQQVEETNIKKVMKNQAVPRQKRPTHLQDKPI